MHFGLTEEQELLQETVRGFAQAECPPAKLREIFDAGSGHDPNLWKGLVEMGVAGLAVPEAHGGAGLERLEWKTHPGIGRRDAIADFSAAVVRRVSMLRPSP
jgi:alkylation response protein AidB-like acyl-CoA dehydrogenase